MKLSYYCVYNVIMIAYTAIGSHFICLNKVILSKGLSEVKIYVFNKNLKLQLSNEINFSFKSFHIFSEF